MFWMNLLQAVCWVALVFVIASIIGSASLQHKYEKQGDAKRLTKTAVWGYVYIAALPFCIAAVLTWG